MHSFYLKILAHSASKMLRTKKFFKAFWYFIRIYGLQPHKLSRFELARALLMFFVVVFINLILLMVNIATKKSADVIVAGILMLPGIATMFVDMSVLILNSREIEEFLVNFSRIINESGEEKLLSKAFDMLMIINKVLGAFASVSIFGTILTFLMTGTSLMPIWVPYSHGPGFLAVWVNQSAFACYQILQLWLVESFLFIMLSILNAYSLYLHRTIQKMSMKRNDLVKCVDDYVQFKA